MVGRSLVRADRALTVAQRLGAPFIRIFSFFLRPDPETGSRAPEQHRDEVLRRMAALAEKAAPTGIVLLHENEKDIYGDVPDRVLDIVESVGSPQLRLIWDAANYVQCGVVPHTEGFEKLVPYTDYVHVKDAKLADGSVTPAGEGDGQVRETVRALRDRGFDGFFSMEPHLAHAAKMGGFSGAELFTKATKAFTDLLTSEHIEYR